MTVGFAEAARAVLLTAAPRDKAMAARRLAREWRAGRLAYRFDVAMPDRPARADRPELLPASRMPKRGRAGSERGRIAMLHALAHIEYGAIDLAVDIAGRFGAEFPRAFIDDWMRVAADEAMHFALLARRLAALRSAYGALPAHDGLWEAAAATMDDALSRLAIVPMVLEARALDVTPAMVARFEAAGDPAAARILKRIYVDEIEHVGIGVRWFEAECRRRRFEPEAKWEMLVGQRFRGAVKPPFNGSARDAAGLTRNYYERIAVNAAPLHKDCAS